MAWVQLSAEQAKNRPLPKSDSQAGQRSQRFGRASLGDLPPARMRDIRSENQGDHDPANVHPTRVDSLTTTRPAFRHLRLLISGSRQSVAHLGT